MGINQNIKFGISKSGIYLLDFIPKQQTERYLHRLNCYKVDYKLVTRKRQFTDEEIFKHRLKNEEEEVCCVFFSFIEKELINKLITAYGFIYKRKHLIPKSNEFICFLMDNTYIIACNKSFSGEIKLMNKYLSQYADFKHKLIYMEDYGIFIPMGSISNIILEDIEPFIDIVDTNHEKILKVHNMVKIYKEEIVGNKYKPPIYYF
ncbi:hypothetical protein [Nostoc sp.]